MPTRKEASKLKYDYILKREGVIRSKISLKQEELYNKIVDEFITQYKFNVEKGSRGDGKDVSELLRKLERSIKKYGLDVNPEILRDYISSARSLGSLNLMYFSTLITDYNKLEAIKIKTDKLLNKRFGIDDEGLIIKDGFLDKMVKDETIQKRIIKEVRTGVSKGIDIQQLRQNLKVLVIGAPGKSGAIEQYYNTFAKDILNSINGANNNIYRQELGLKHAYYAGGLIKTSRSLCLKNNGKIFSTKQIEALREDPFIVNMYGANIGDYDPYELPGGYGCLHSWDWITEDLAKGNTRDQNKKASERNEAFKNRNGL